jgi:hypothetical protein
MALKAINASQFAQLEELFCIVSAQQARRAPVTSPGLAAARRTANTPKSSTAKRMKS